MTTAAAEPPFRIDERAVGYAQFLDAALEPARSVIVQACAGSGKTWLLVARLLRALLAGARPHEVLAITFTRKAAKEIEARLFATLRELATAAEPEALALLEARGLAPGAARAALPRARRLLEEILASPRPLSIGTFHVWFADIVRHAPLGSGVYPGFAISERTGPLRAAARRRFLADLAHDAALCAAWTRLLEHAGEHTARLMVERLVARRNEWRAFLAGRGPEEGLAELAFEFGAAAPEPRQALLDDAEFVRRYRRLAEALAKGSDVEQRRAAAGLAALERLALGFDAADFDELVAMLRRRQPYRATLRAREARGTVAGVPADVWFEQEHAELVRQLDGALDAHRERVSFEVNRDVWHCAWNWLAHYERVKQARGLVDFDDLEWLAFGLARDPDSAAYIQTRLDARYRHVLVDEFQDTNPLQWGTLRSWLDAYGEDASRPSVFIVGDPLQSIYRFRRAEPRLFDEAERFLVERFGACRLGTRLTRRCAPAIVTLVNSAFAQNAAESRFSAHLTEVGGNGAAFGLADPTPDMDAPALRSEVQVLSLRDVLSQPLDEDDEDRHDLEAGQVAAAALHLHERHRVDDRHGQPARPARWSDMLVLVRARAAIPHLERALRAASIPYRSDRAGGLLATLEAQDIGALLKFLVVPFSDLLLAHVLRTPLFGVTDEDLIRLAQARGGRSWWQRLAGLPKADPLARHAATLARWIALAGQLPVHDLLDRIYDEGRVIERYLASLPPQAPAALGEQVRANLLAYLELALEVDGGRYPSLPRFIEELEALASGSDEETPDEGPTDVGDAVRILTVHGAKGLEAPIVFLTGCRPGRRGLETPGVVIDWPATAPRPTHISVFGKVAEHGPMQRRRLEEEGALAAREDWNVLYVGVTRAREILVMSGASPARGGREDSWFARCQAALAPFPEVAPSDTRPAPSASETSVADFRPPRLELGARIVATQPQSSLAQARGIALHRALEVLLENVPDAALAVRAARATGVSDDVARDVVGVAMRILGTPELARFFVADAYRRAYNEVELIAGDGQLLRIDRLVEFADETWVLDYKSQSSADGVAAHRAQLERYRDAVLGLGTATRVRVAVIFSDAVLAEL